MHRLTLPAKRIPVGSTVTKQRGDKEYVIGDNLTVYRRDTRDKTRDRKIEIRPEADEVLLLAPGYAQIERDDAELVWLATPQEFAEYVARHPA